MSKHKLLWEAEDDVVIPITDIYAEDDRKVVLTTKQATTLRIVLTNAAAGKPVGIEPSDD